MLAADPAGLNRHSLGSVGVEIPELVDRIIIGPTAYPVPMAQAFALPLHSTGVPDAGNRVVVLNIPIMP
jgi:hypothetical protein